MTDDFAKQERQRQIARQRAAQIADGREPPLAVLAELYRSRAASDARTEARKAHDRERSRKRRERK